jgi:hypothetical protein
MCESNAPESNGPSASVTLKEFVWGLNRMRTRSIRRFWIETHYRTRAKERQITGVFEEAYLAHKVDERDQCARLERFSIGEEQKVDPSRLKSRGVWLYY